MGQGLRLSRVCNLCWRPSGYALYNRPIKTNSKISEQTTQSSHLRGQSIVVSKADLFHSNGVILIDNRNGVICQQLLKGIASIQVWPPVAQVVQCQQYLSTRLQASASASQALTEMGHACYA